ncbi:hypothetical protein ABFS83_05G026300 [Erythranthe nasuta]
MRSGKSNREEEEEEEDDEDSGTQKDANPSNNSTRDGKNSDKANAMRSKHSVTEQRRRSKINERFQVLRKLIPHSDQKRDTASFLLEVIQYVQFLQQNVQNYEESYRPSSSEPTKLMPWRNSHLRVDPSSTFHGKFDRGQHIPIESIDTPSDAQPSNGLNNQEDLIIEGGTIGISGVYSQRLLNSFTQALESTGVDLSQATISVQINLGKRANKDQSTSEDLDQSQKRFKT